MSLCATEGCSSPGRAGCFEPQKTEPRCACTGPPRFTALGRRSHAQNEQLKRAHSKQQNYDCDPIIFEPMPAHCIHGRTFPLSDSPVTLAHPCFQSYFAGKHFCFAVCGENPANVSRFVAQIWLSTLPTHGSIWQRCSARWSMKDAICNAKKSPAGRWGRASREEPLGIGARPAWCGDRVPCSKLVLSDNRGPESSACPDRSSCGRCQFGAPPPLPDPVRAPGRQRCTVEVVAACVSHVIPSKPSSRRWMTWAASWSPLGLSHQC